MRKVLAQSGSAGRTGRPAGHQQALSPVGTNFPYSATRFRLRATGAPVTVRSYPPHIVRGELRCNQWASEADCGAEQPLPGIFRDDHDDVPNVQYVVLEDKRHRSFPGEKSATLPVICLMLASCCSCLTISFRILLHMIFAAVLLYSAELSGILPPGSVGELLKATREDTSSVDLNLEWRLFILTGCFFVRPCFLQQ